MSNIKLIDRFKNLPDQELTRWQYTIHLLMFISTILVASLVTIDYKLSSSFVAALLALFVVSGRFMLGVRAIWQSTLGKVIVFYVGLMFLSTLWSVNGGFGLAKTHMILFALILLPTIFSRKEMLIIFTIFAFSTLFAIFSHFGVEAGLWSVFWKDYPFMSFGKITRTHFSVIVAVAILSFYFLTHTTNDKRYKSVLWFLAIFCTLLLFTHEGRGGQVAFLVAVFVMAWLKTMQKYGVVRSTTISVVFVVLSSSIIYTSSTVVQNRFKAAVSDIEQMLVHDNFRTSVGQRLGSWMVATSIIKEHPFFGVGMSSQMRAFREALDTKYPEYKDHFPVIKRSHFHNEYVEIAVQLGLVGLALLIAFFVACAVKAYKNGNGIYGVGVVTLFMVNAITQVILSRDIEVIPMIIILSFLYAVPLEKNHRRGSEISKN